MYYYNYIGIFVFFSFLILVSIFLLNFNGKNSKNDEENKKKLYNILFGNFNTFMHKKESSMLYLIHDKESLFFIKNTIKDIYLKVIILLNTKDVNNIKNADFISEKMKESLLLNLENISILNIKEVKNVEIVSIIDKRIEAIITNVMVRNNTNDEVLVEIVDKWFFIHGPIIVLDTIEVKLYRNNSFIHMENILQNRYKEVLI